MEPSINVLPETVQACDLAGMLGFQLCGGILPNTGKR